MPLTRTISLCLACLLLPVPLQAQVLRNPSPAVGAAPEELPPYRAVRPQPTSELNATIKRVRELLQELRQSDLSPEQKQATLNELISDRNNILRQHDTWLDWQQPQTVDSAALLLEKMIFQEAAELAPTEQGREQILREAPKHLEIEPAKKQTGSSYQPPLAGPVDASKQQEQAVETDKPSAVAVEATTAPLPAATDNKQQENAENDNTVTLAAAVDGDVTNSMHDDNTVLRDVRDENGKLVFFGKVDVWLGGAVQLDAYYGDGLFTLQGDGDWDSKSYIRRGEGILRASVLDNSETKAQYDFDANEFRDLYWRWTSDKRAHTLTVGNQKEPTGLDYLMGSKFTTALETSAPTTAFGGLRSVGIRYDGRTTLESQDNPFKIWGDSRTYVTGSLGLFGEDIENSNDTDWAITGRISMGGNKTENSGFHLGASTSYRHGEFDRIAPRPGLQDVSRIFLAQPVADTQVRAALEGALSVGSLHGQAEVYYSDYSGDQVDADGWGAYSQLGWLFGGKRRPYRPNWGLWAPIDATKQQVFEVFARASLTHGNDDVNSSNDLGLLTLGGNWYYRNARLSVNVLLADTKRDLNDEDDGHAFALRLQYLF